MRHCIEVTGLQHSYIKPLIWFNPGLGVCSWWGWHFSLNGWQVESTKSRLLQRLLDRWVFNTVLIFRKILKTFDHQTTQELINHRITNSISFHHQLRSVKVIYKRKEGGNIFKALYVYCTVYREEFKTVSSNSILLQKQFNLVNSFCFKKMDTVIHMNLRRWARKKQKM